jgi:hypothetical protein
MLLNSLSNNNNVIPHAKIGKLNNNNKDIIINVYINNPKQIESNILKQNAVSTILIEDPSLLKPKQ